jgi:hypothetical protein
MLSKRSTLTLATHVMLFMDGGDNASFRHKTTLMYLRRGLSVLQAWRFQKPGKVMAHVREDNVSRHSV